MLFHRFPNRLHDVCMLNALEMEMEMEMEDYLEYTYNNMAIINKATQL
jgi:hypothetical protein